MHLISQLDFRTAMQYLGRILDLVKIQAISNDSQIILEKALNCINHLVSINSVKNR